MAWFRQWLQGTGGADAPEERAATTSGAASAAPGASDAHGDGTSGAAVEDDAWPGQSLGLPERGQGSVARLPLRAGQFVLDAVLAGLVAALFTYPAPPQNWSLLVWALLLVVPVATIGMTPAMAMLGIRLLRMDHPDRTGVGLPWALVRTLVLFFVVPAAILDRHGRGLQDRASRTIAIRTR